jgi:hypothetical protein
MKDNNWEFSVKYFFPEPNSGWQNPIEARSICWLKNTVKVLMDHGQRAPDIVWVDVMDYMVDIYNHTADEMLRWITAPIEKRKGNTPDVSAYLAFTFNECVYYIDSDSTFPSSTKEKTGYWLGVSKNIGDVLTYKILTDDKKETIIRQSVVHTAD